MRGLHLITIKMVFVYIDGFNLYHGVSKFSNQSLKWVSIPSLIRAIYNQDKNKNYKIKFFTSRPEHIKYQGDDKLSRHDNYVALQTELGVQIINGNFARRNIKCKKCDNHGLVCPKCNESKIYGHDEKQTDVNLAINILSDSFVHKPKEIIICSADTDFVPVINCLSIHKLVSTIRIAIPPNVKSVPQDIRIALGNFYNLPINKRSNSDCKITLMQELHFKQAILPNEVNVNNKKYINPYL
jgi:uncharacterized LabA/DUF88 family protein